MQPKYSPNRHHIYFGNIETPLFAFDWKALRDINILTSIDVAGEELNVDTIEFVVFYNDTDASFQSLVYGTPIFYCEEIEPKGKFYLESITKISSRKFRVKGISVVGLLNNETFYGGYYEENNFKNCISELLIGNGLAEYVGYYNSATTYADSADDAKQMKTVATGTSRGEANSSYPFFRSATMHSKMQAKFTYLGTSFQYGSGFTWFRLNLLGAANGATSSTQVLYPELRNLNYGMYVILRRNSTSDPWPNFGEVFFHYNTTVISLGTPTQSTTYVLDVDPARGTAIINGTSYNITDPGIDDLMPMHCAFGGVSTSLNSDKKIIGSIVNEYAHGCSCKWEYYRLYSQDGELQTDVRYVQNYFSGDVCTYDLGTIRANSYAGKVIFEDDIVDYYDNPAFFHPSDEMISLADNAIYEDGIDQLKVSGWLPICTKREALHDFLFSMSVSLKKTGDGNLVFSSLKKEVISNIPSERIYLNGEIENKKRVNTIEVSEYSYTYDDSTTLFQSDTDTEDFYIVKIDGGVRYITSTQSTIQCLIWGWNACVVKGSGILVGWKLNRQEIVRSKKIGDYPDGVSVKVDDCKLITAKNSETIIEKMASYYGQSQIVRTDIVSESERCGEYCSFIDPAHESKNGFLVKSDKTVSAVTRGKSEFIVGFNPPKPGATFDNFIILTGSGTWEVPSSVFEKDIPKIKIVLIGGGNGGNGGCAGEDGEVPEEFRNVTAAKGGNAGNPGAGGRVYQVTIENPPTSISYNCGSGGLGGDISHETNISNPGTSGTETEATVNDRTYSTQYGARYEKGIANAITGDVYAKTPSIANWGKTDVTTINGYEYKTSVGNGGDGGHEEMTEDNKILYQLAGMSAAVFKSIGQGGGDYTQRGESYPSTGSLVRYTGGMGGGGGYGENGQNGGDATSNKAGSGGDGGNAIYKPPKPTDYNAKLYGWGGYGGGGGGGGGAAGLPINASGKNTAGKGGYGGEGGDGSNGCVLIYY